jgi:tetratricopeptide (TPR) repeat protein
VSASIVILPGCARISQYLYLRSDDAEISKGTKAIESAKNDSERAAAYAQRGSAIGEKARYSRAFKLISHDEHARMMDLAMKDHDQAVALAPKTAEVYYLRGRTRYMQSTLAPMVPEEAPFTQTRLAAAKADFSKAIELDPRHVMAYDFRGLTDESTGDWDQAIADYTQELALEPKSRYRLADAYCNRGSNVKDKNYDRAIADLEKSIEMGNSSDGCECEPYNPLLAIYLFQKADLEKARDVARRAKAKGKWIEPEYLEKLK